MRSHERSTRVEIQRTWLPCAATSYRVFYNDIAAAVKWLTETPLPARLTSVK